nr:uncharacterized protein LOC124805828 isoform X3 [Hydra vulgaris]
MDLSMYGENLNFSSSDEISSDEESGNIKEVYEQSLSIIENNCLPTRDIVYEMIAKNHNVLWEDYAIQYSGIPHMVVGHKILDCHHGFDRNISAKNSYKKKKKNAKMDDHSFQKNYVILQDTKKFLCPAKIVMREILQFPDFKIPKHSAWHKKKASKLLKEKLKLSCLNEVPYIRKVVVAIDDLSCHDKHPIGKVELISQIIDPHISKKIEEYVIEGIYNIREMKHLLRLTVKDTFGNENLPPSNSRRFYPNTAIIRSHIVKIKNKLRHSMIDQECLLIKCEEWKKCGPSVKVFLRPNCSGEDGGDKCSFLFVYQSQWQQHLLMRYGTLFLSSF